MNQVQVAYAKLESHERSELVKAVFALLPKAEKILLKKHAQAFGKVHAKGLGIVSYLELILAVHVHPGARAYLEKVKR